MCPVNFFLRVLECGLLCVAPTCVLVNRQRPRPTATNFRRQSADRSSNATVKINIHIRQTRTGFLSRPQVHYGLGQSDAEPFIGRGGSVLWWTSQNAIPFKLTNMWRRRWHLLWARVMTPLCCSWRRVYRSAENRCDGLGRGDGNWCRREMKAGEVDEDGTLDWRANGRTRRSTVRRVDESLKWRTVNFTTGTCHSRSGRMRDKHSPWAPAPPNYTVADIGKTTA